MPRKLATTFKTYAALQSFADNLLKCGSQKAADELMHRLLAGKQMTPAVISAVLISAHKRKNPDCAFFFMDFCHKTYSIDFTAEHYTLALRCQISEDKLHTHFFGQKPAELRRRSTWKTPQEDTDQKALPETPAEVPFQSRSFHELLELPVVRYYSAQKLLRNEQETHQFVTTLNKSLTRDVSYSAIKSMYRDDMALFGKVNHLLGYSDRVVKAFAETAKKTPTKSLLAARDPKTKNTLKQMHDRGLVSIQSPGSSLAVDFLQIEPGMRVLDLCAAPGNKTLTILEKVGRNQGCVIANDQSTERCRSLYKRYAAFGPANLMVTGYPANRFPATVSLQRIPSKGSSTELTVTSKLRFDRILVDISCSGDGRILKDPRILPKWSAFDGVTQFPSQKQALLRALQLVELDGLVLYVTCSMNPLENEAVIAAILRMYPDHVRVMKLQNSTEKLRPGLTTWGVPQNKTAVQFQNTTQSIFQKSESHLAKAGDILRSGSALAVADQHTEMFPLHQLESSQKNSWIVESLKECRRLMPTDDTDSSTGFFYALLKKVKEFPHSSNETSFQVCTDRKKILEVLTSLKVSKEFFQTYAVAFREGSQNVSFALSKDVTRAIGVKDIGNKEKLYFASGNHPGFHPVCTLSRDNGRSLTFPAVQLVGPFVDTSRSIEIDEKAFLFLVQHGGLNSAYFSDAYGRVSNRDGWSRQKAYATVEWFNGVKPVESGSVDGPLVVTVKRPSVLKGTYLYVELEVKDDWDWKLVSEGVPDDDRSRILALFE